MNRYSRTFFREVADRGGAAATPPANAVSAADIMADVESFETHGLPGATPSQSPSGPDGASDTTSIAGKETKPAAKPTTGTEETPITEIAPSAEPTLWTPEEFKAELAKADGNWDKLDWKKIPEEYRSYASTLKGQLTAAQMRYAARAKVLEDELARLKASPPAPTVNASAEPTAEELSAAVKKYLDPENASDILDGLEVLLRTEKGKGILGKLGYDSPRERAVVSNLVKQQGLLEGLAIATEGLPEELVKSEPFQAAVNDAVIADPILLAKAHSGDPESVRDAFAIAIGRELIKLRETEAAGFSAKRADLDKREAAVTSKEAEMNKEIERRNRRQPNIAARTERPGSPPAGDQTVQDIVSDMWPQGGLTV